MGILDTKMSNSTQQFFDEAFARTMILLLGVPNGVFAQERKLVLHEEQVYARMRQLTEIVNGPWSSIAINREPRGSRGILRVLPF